MKITILEETKREIVLKVEDECCPFCNSNKIRNKGNYLSKINKECIKKFFLKDVYLKRIRYQCNDCNKCFSEKIFFRDISDERFKPYLRILLDRDILVAVKKITKAKQYTTFFVVQFYLNK